MFELFQIVVLFVFFASILLFIGSKILRLVLNFIFSLFLSLECYSLYFGGNLIDYKFYKHFNLSDITHSFSFFWKETLILLILISLFVFILNFCYKTFHDKAKNKFLLGITIVGLVLMSFSGGILNNIYQIISLNNVKEHSLDKALNELDINPKDYVYSNDVKAEKGKNIVIISLESFEKGFMGEKLKDITPNLRSYKEKYNYYDMNQGNGSEWTSGSIYTFLTGVPMFFKRQGNSILQNAVDSKLTGISHVLNKAGYNQLYLIGNPEFSGMDDLLRTYNIDFLSQSYYDEKYGVVPFGLHDYDLFDEAKSQVLELSKQNKPFALYLSTISTHFPNGKYDKRLEKYISRKDSDLEFMAASVDYMLNDFISYLEEHNLLEDTVFYIFPDHLFMGGNYKVTNKFDSRELFLITNAEKQVLNNFDSNNPIEQIDLPKIILDGAEIKHNAKFLADYIVGEKKGFIEQNKKKLVALNQASLRIDGFDEDFTISLKSFDGLLTSNTINLKSETKSLSFETDSFSIKKNRYHAFVFDDLMRVKHIKSSRKNLLYYTFNDRVNILIDIVDSTTINAFIRKGSLIGRSKRYAQKDIKILADDINDLSIYDDYDFYDKVVLDDKHFKINSTEGSLFITSSVKNKFPEPSIPASIYLNKRKLNHKEGINLVLLDTPNNVMSYKINHNNKDLEKFINKVSSLVLKGKRFVLFSDNVKRLESKDLRAKLKSIGLYKLADLRYKKTYVCFSENGIIVERTDSKPISIQVDIDSRKSKFLKNELNKIKNDRTRFIAHAGGEIEGHTYTNSLEALNLSYKKGFRLFELDIIKTKDGKFVAAHDWKRWKKRNGYNKDDEITLSDFMKKKIENKFSPLSMVEINSWFKNHPEATLVTDKINTPTDFANKFVNKKRLIMELFSKEAVKEAYENDIEFLAAPSVFKGMKLKQKLELIDKYDVKYMSVSINSINDYTKPFYKRLKAKGVKLYGYHISFNKWKDENYVFLNDMEYLYGIYADNWFLKN